MSGRASQIRILILIPNLGRGGAQQVFRQHIRYLSHHFEVKGCVFNWDGAFAEDHQEGIISLDVPAGGNYFSKAYCFLQRIIRLRKLKFRLKTDLTISHLEGADYINILSRRNDKAVCWIHGTKEFDKNIHGWLGFLRMNLFMPFLYRRSDQLVTVSEGIKSELKKNITGITSKVQTIYNGFDIHEISSLYSEPLDDQFEFLFTEFRIVITHCRLSRQKNLEALLLIHQQVKSIGNVKLVIVGDGELRDSLLLQSRQLGLRVWSGWDNENLDFLADVYFIGQQRNPFKFLRRSTLYIMTSSWEGFPLSLGEALACGLNVISADCYTGPREIIAPDADVQQPLRTPFRGKYGTLMPLADMNDHDLIQLWVMELRNLLTEMEWNKGRFNTEAFGRSSKFQISETIKQTIKVVEQIL